MRLPVDCVTSMNGIWHRCRCCVRCTVHTQSNLCIVRGPSCQRHTAKTSNEQKKTHNFYLECIVFFGAERLSHNVIFIWYFQQTEPKQTHTHTIDLLCNCNLHRRRGSVRRDSTATDSHPTSIFPIRQIFFSQQKRKKQRRKHFKIVK